MKKSLILLLTCITFLTPLSVHALAPLVPSCATTGSGGFCCALWTVSNLSRLILGLMGAVALLFFIYGGFKWITSAGESGRVKEGQKMMTQTVIGMAIIALAWVVVNFVVTSLADKPQLPQLIKGVDRTWYQVCEGSDAACKELGADWNCQPPIEGGNCVKGLCPGGIDNVCCKK